MSLALTLSTVSLAHAAGRVCDVHALGATGDGLTKDTAAIQKAIDNCAQAGGGTVHFAAGTYLSAPLDWKSHVRLQLDSGATLLGSPDMADYPVRDDAPWRRVSLLHADHVTDIALTGAGTVDGSGQIWWTQQQSDRHAGLKEKPRPMLFDLQEEEEESGETRIMEPIPAPGEIKVTATHWLDEVSDGETGHSLEWPAHEDRDLQHRERIDTPRVRHLFPVPDSDWSLSHPEFEYKRR